MCPPAGSFISLLQHIGEATSLDLHEVSRFGVSHALAGALWGGGVAKPMSATLTTLIIQRVCVSGGGARAHICPGCAQHGRTTPLVVRAQECGLSMKYELPGSSPPTFIDLLNDADVSNMWEAWREHGAMQAAASGCGV